MLLLSFFLVLGLGNSESYRPEKCSELPCFAAQTYEYDGVTYQGACPPEDSTNIYYKRKGWTEGATNIEEFCQQEGYDGSGRTWASLPPELDTSPYPSSTVGDEINECNVGYEWWPYLNDYKGDYWYQITFECVYYNDGPADCCTNWTGECYNRRSDKNKFHACWMCGPPPGPCYGPCGGGNMIGAPGSEQESEACRECCQSQQHETDWRCDEVPDHMTEDQAREACNAANDSKNSCKKAIENTVGKCKFKKKNNGNHKCTLKKYYGPCNTLTGKACKHMVKKGICTSDDDFETCQDAE